MKIYACNTATHTSNSNNTINSPIGINNVNNDMKLTELPAIDVKTNLNIKNAIQSKRICPATIFANNRRDKLNTLNIVEINSITDRKKIKGIEAPFGKNNAKYLIPHSLNPINMIPNHTIKPKPNVIAKWLVTVKL